jgi:hypothetical protein
MQDHNGEPVLIQLLTRAYHRLLLAIFALLPLTAIAYLHAFQTSALRFENHAVHEVAISVAIALSAFATYVTWRCYRGSGEVFLRWLTLGFLGFTIIYLPHGLLTRHVSEDLALFLIFGPTSRLLMAACFLTALLRYDEMPDGPSDRQRPRFWAMGVAVFVVIMALATGIGQLAWVQARTVLVALEVGALMLSLGGIALMALRRIRTPLMTAYMISLAFFAQSSLSFILAAPLESSVVAGSRYLCCRILSAQLRDRAGISHNEVILNGLQPG